MKDDGCNDTAAERAPVKRYSAMGNELDLHRVGANERIPTNRRAMVECHHFEDIELVRVLMTFYSTWKNASLQPEKH